MNTLEPGSFFDRCYPLLTGITHPYHWQRELFLRFCAGEYPPEIDLPTGTGKTSLMDVWFTAVTFQSMEGNLKIPRRLVWVVNRRVVVDQATNRAKGIAENAAKLPPEYIDALRGLSITGCEAPAISTLRGEKADNREWTKDPSRPAIIIGTVDMIGSRLLFSGYGDGDYYRPQHAGLLGVDTLIVNDEAHLTPAFVHLLEGIAARRPAAHIPGKEYRHISLFATHTGQVRSRFPTSLDEDIAASEVFRTRVSGNKLLFLNQVTDGNMLEPTMRELALQPAAGRTIIYIEQPEKALDMFRKIDKLHPGRVELLTGTMRGYERDRLLETAVVKGMLREDPPTDPAFLVATSAGEVGIDITSERQVSALVSADRLIQRFGRLNRFGTGRGEAHIVYTPPKERDSALGRTLEYLERLEKLGDGLDIRSLTLRRNPPPADAQTEIPAIAALHDWVIELWCQTSDPVRGYPKVEAWLHGQAETEGPETEIAWREDVPFLASEAVTDEQRKLALRYHRVLVREKLREPTRRLTEKLAALAVDQPSAKILVQRKDRSILVCTIREAGELELDYCLVLLPPKLGALVHGMFHSAQSKETEAPDDVADHTTDEEERRRERWTCEQDDQDGYDLKQLPAKDWIEPETTDDLKTFADARGMRIMLQIPVSAPDDEKIPQRSLIYLREQRRLKPGGGPILLETHTVDVSSNAARLAELLVPGLTEVFRDAGRLHDTGKASPLWQRAMGNTVASRTVAKPIRFTKGGSGLAGYRHELGSLVEALRPGSIAPSPSRELQLHLIASHHGHARPHFPPNAHDARALRESEQAMMGSPNRFGLLVGEWGPWGLAYLESIFKAADGIASALAERNSAAEEQPDNEQD